MTKKPKLPRREFLMSSALALGGIAWAGNGARLRIGVAGLKHSHVNQILNLAAKDPSVEIVAFADDDEQNRKELERTFGHLVRYSTIGSYSSPRNSMHWWCARNLAGGEKVVIAALRAGKHVFCDKPSAPEWRSGRPSRPLRLRSTGRSR